MQISDDFQNYWQSSENTTFNSNYRASLPKSISTFQPGNVPFQGNRTVLSFASGLDLSHPIGVNRDSWITSTSCNRLCHCKFESTWLRSLYNLKWVLRSNVIAVSNFFLPDIWRQLLPVPHMASLHLNFMNQCSPLSCPVNKKQIQFYSRLMYLQV